MSNYTKATNFAVKDTLSTGDTNKVVRGTEIDTEFTAIASAIASKADTASPTFTGTPLAPTASTATENTQIATTAYVANKISAIAAGVTSFSAGTTGLTPSTGTTGTVTLAGTLATTNGGTGATTTAGARSNLNVPQRDGTDATGTWGIGISGNAATATKLSTASGTAPSYSARAWVNFNGSSSSPSIRDDDNVSTVSYGGVAGFFTVNFSTSMPSSSYAALVTCGIGTGQIAISARSDVQNTGSFTTSTVDQSGTGAWAEDVMAAVFI